MSLNRLLNTLAESEIVSLLRKFRSQKNADLQDFIHNKAIDYEKRDRTRTFLFIENGKVIAFFSLALNVFDTTKFSNSTKKKLSPINSKDDKYIACFLIGQLGKDDEATIKGQDILNTAVFSLQTAHSLLGSKFILVDSINNEKVIQFYTANGFKSIAPDEDGQTIKMVMFFKDKVGE